MAKMTATEAAIRVMESEGVELTFGVPGAAILPLYQAMNGSKIKHVLVRHEEGGTHAAEGYTRAASGRIGVCIGTSGPAGTNMITGLYSAMADSIPILCITGQAPRNKLHKEDFQAVDIAAIAKPVTKWAITVMEAAQVPRAFRYAFHLMRSGRPGPVLIDLPLDVQKEIIEYDPDSDFPMDVFKPRPQRKQIEKALDMMMAAQRPLIFSGGGVINADASGLLVELAELTQTPVIPTLMGWGSIPDDHPLNAGMMGLQTQHRYGNATFLRSDFVLGIGNRWANRQTGSLDVFTKGRKFVHVDIDPMQIGRIFCPDIGIVSDARYALEEFVAAARARKQAGKIVSRKQWIDEGQERKFTMQRRTDFDNVPIKPQRVFQEINNVFGDDTLLRDRHRPVPDRLRPVPEGQQAAQLHRLRPGWTARLGNLGVHRRQAGRPEQRGGRRGRRLFIPVPDRGTRGRRPTSGAVRDGADQQCLSRVDSSGRSRLQNGL